MSEKRAKPKVHLCYTEDENCGDQVQTLSQELQKEGVTFTGTDDGRPGRPELPQIAQMMEDAIWIFMFFTTAFSFTEFGEFLLALAAEISIRKRLRNIVVLCQQHLEEVPNHIFAMSAKTVSMSDEKWKEIVTDIAKGSPRTMELPDDYAIGHTVDIRHALFDAEVTYHSDPGNVSSDEEKGHGSRFLDYYQRKKILRKLKRRSPSTLCTQVTSLSTRVQESSKHWKTAIEDWAWYMFKQVILGANSTLGRNEFKINIALDGLTFRIVQDTQWELVDKENTSKVVYLSSFQNNTHKQQMHTFSLERSTTDTAFVKTENNVDSHDLMLKLPENIIAGTHFEKCIPLGKAVEKVQSWDVNRTVCVPGNTTVKVALEIHEVQATWAFSTKVHLTGHVRCSVTDLEGETLFEARPKVQKILADLSCLCEKDTVEFAVNGKGHFNHGVSQDIKMYEI